MVMKKLKKKHRPCHDAKFDTDDVCSVQDSYNVKVFGTASQQPASQ